MHWSYARNRPTSRPELYEFILCSRPPNNSIPLRSYLDQLDEQHSRSSIANFDAYDSHGMVAVSRRGRRGVQDEFSQPAAGCG
jgi:hypothetical protein